MLYFFFSDCVLINIFKMFFLLSIFSVVVVMHINKVSVIIFIVHRIDVVVWVSKEQRVNFGRFF